MITATPNPRLYAKIDRDLTALDHNLARAKHGIEIRLSADVPEEILRELSRKNAHLRFTEFKHVFHCINVHYDKWIGVAGDADNATYEHFMMCINEGQLGCSDVGYGSTCIALRDVLQQHAS
jgi:hypothetical protein